MNLILRVFAVWLSHFFRPKLRLTDESVLKLPVLLNDLDIYGHMNNGRYLTHMDLGRMDLILRTGLKKLVKKHGWDPIVASSAIEYRKSLKLFDRYQLKSRIVCWDEKWLYLEQRFEKAGIVVASGFIRGLFLGKKGKIPTAEVLKSIGFESPSPPMPEGIALWGGLRDLSQPAR